MQTEVVVVVSRKVGVVSVGTHLCTGLAELRVLLGRAKDGNRGRYGRYKQQLSEFRPVEAAKSREESEQAAKRPTDHEVPKGGGMQPAERSAQNPHAEGEQEDAVVKERSEALGIGNQQMEAREGRGQRQGCMAHGNESQWR